MSTNKADDEEGISNEEAGVNLLPMHLLKLLIMQLIIIIQSKHLQKTRYHGGNKSVY